MIDICLSLLIIIRLGVIVYNEQYIYDNKYQVSVHHDHHSQTYALPIFMLSLQPLVQWTSLAVPVTLLSMRRSIAADDDHLAQYISLLSNIFTLVFSLKLVLENAL